MNREKKKDIIKNKCYKTYKNCKQNINKSNKHN